MNAIDRTVFDEELSKRITQLGLYLDYVKMLNQVAVTMPEQQKVELSEKIARIAEVLHWETEQLIDLNREFSVKH
jgi:hypothetical protein